MRQLALLLLCLLSGAPAGAQDVATLEAEAAKTGGGGVEGKPNASGGKALGDYWGSRAGHFAEFAFVLPEAEEVVAGVRYAFDAEQFRRRFPDAPRAHALRVLLDGREIHPALPCPDTAGWDVFAFAQVDLGKLGAGPHTLRLQPAADLHDVVLDQVVLAGPERAFDARGATLLPAESRRFRLRLSPRVNPYRFPARRTLAYLEAQHAFTRDFLGFAPERPDKILLTVVADRDWRGTDASAYTSFGNLYMQEKEVADPGNNYAHELFHVFEEGMEYPTWWSEGMAFLVAMRAEVELYGKPEAELRAEIDRLRAWWRDEGRALLVRDGVNAAQWWGSDRLPPNIPTGALYRAANLMVYELWEAQGDAFFRRLYDRLNADRRAGRYRIPGAGIAEKNRLLRGYLDAAASGSLKGFWRGRLDFTAGD